MANQYRKKTQSVVTLNVKITAANLVSVPVTGETTFDEGVPITLDAGYGAEPTGGGAFQFVYVNWAPGARSDVEFLQNDPSDDSSPTISIQSGGLAAIVGNGGFEIGLPTRLWHGGTLPTAGQLVTINASSKLWAGLAVGSATQDHYYHGIVTRVVDDRAFFLFSSIPFLIIS